MTLSLNSTRQTINHRGSTLVCILGSSPASSVLQKAETLAETSKQPNHTPALIYACCAEQTIDLGMPRIGTSSQHFSSTCHHHVAKDSLKWEELWISIIDHHFCNHDYPTETSWLRTSSLRISATLFFVAEFSLMSPRFEPWIAHTVVGNPRDRSNWR